MRKYLIHHFNKTLNVQSGNKEAIQGRIDNINVQIDNLIKLENSGSISTSILADRVKKLDDELEDLRKLLNAKANDNVNVSNLLAFAGCALKNPSLLWQKKPIDIQKKVQVFEFPEGVVFDGLIFRTPKVRSVFQLKELLDDEKFSRVPSRDGGKNTVPTTNMPPYDINLLETKEFWETVVEDLRVLKDIIANR